LLDEIEKAHPEVFNMLLQIMDDGHLSDAKGRKVDFRNTIIIMTSNVGSDLLKRDVQTGFRVKKDEARTAEEKYERMKEKVTTELKNVFRPEFLNRLDATVVFHALGREHLVEIVDLMLNRVRKQLAEQEITLEVDEAAKDWLLARGYDPSFGARPLRRVIQNYIEDLLADGLLQRKWKGGDTVLATVADGELKVEVRELVPAGAAS
ncbi:MAG: ATP-dependent Clp protease ATP-binding subunit, partial [Chloroflexi bacterium]|nr:ATP-dependent Clp protease ATP-binding subunit [Chloroflexota bacterium]